MDDGMDDLSPYSNRPPIRTGPDPNKRPVPRFGGRVTPGGMDDLSPYRLTPLNGADEVTGRIKGQVIFPDLAIPTDDLSLDRSVPFVRMTCPPIRTPIRTCLPIRTGPDPNK